METLDVHAQAQILDLPLYGLEERVKEDASMQPQAIDGVPHLSVGEREERTAVATEAAELADAISSLRDRREEALGARARASR